MRMERCANGHFYDADKSSTCPYCAELSGGSRGDDVTSGFYNPGAAQDDGLGVTMAGPVYPQQGGPVPAVSAPNPQGAGAEDDDTRTVGLIPAAVAAKEAGEPDVASAVNPVVGWLVCTEGSCYGRAFTLFAGKNFIGRDPSMDIRLTGDNAISRITHAIIIYEPIQRQFYAQPGESHSLFYVNEEVVLASMLLKDRDVISIGNTTLVFVPFCDENHGWGI